MAWPGAGRIMLVMSVRTDEAARIADATEGVSIDELRLAARNHGMPLEALSLDVTPVGLHYLLAHYDIPFVNPTTWRLSVSGRVGTPLTLDLAALRSLPSVTIPVTLECAGNGRARLLPRPVSQPWLDEAVGTAEWTGVPLTTVLGEAGVADDAVDVVFTGQDHGTERGVEQDYQRSLPVSQLADVLLAYEMNGAPLPPQHGAPVRVIVPGWYGMAHVKWLRDIEVVATPFTGYQNAIAYRDKQSAEDEGTPITRIRPRALMIPPGFPDFMTRRRYVDAGAVTLTGRAWSGRAPLTEVELSTDDGKTWTTADLGPSAGRYAWHPWTATWQATPGTHTLSARAADAEGRQPTEQPWNTQGMANNMTQRIPVVVR